MNDTIGFDLAKSVFQVHAAAASGAPILRRKLRRSQVETFFRNQPPCLVAMEACGSAHHWARLLQSLGHEVRLVPPKYVKPFVKTGKNDVTDAEAICEAASRPTMRFVPVKSAEQQSLLMLHRARELLVRQRTQIMNALRGHCGEFGIVVAKGACNVARLVEVIEDGRDSRIPDFAREVLCCLVAQLRQTDRRIAGLDKRLKAWHRTNAASRRLATIPGIGVITATALVATVGDASQFRSGSQLAAWLGLVPKQFSTGGKTRLGRITKHGDTYPRRLLVHGARATLRWSRSREATGTTDRYGLWQQALLARRPVNVVLVAMANKMARMAWALLTRSEVYRPQATATA